MNRPVPLVYQHDSKDCGPSCLQMLHQAHGGYIPITRMRDLCDLTIDGVSMAGIERAARALGMVTQAAKVTPDQLDSLPTPFIAHWLQEHFVVVVRVTPDSVRVADPELGWVTYGRKEFTDRWLGRKMFGEVERDPSLTSGAVLMASPGPEFVTGEAPASESGLDMVPLPELLKSNSRTVWAILLAFPVIAGVTVALPILMQRVIDDALAESDLGLLYVLLGGYLVLSISGSVIGALRDLALLRLGAMISLEIVQIFMTRLLRLRMRFFEIRSLGDLLQRQADRHRIEQFLTSHSLPTLFSLILFVIFAIMLGSYSLWVLACVLVAAALTLAWIVAIGRRRRRFDLQQFELEGLVQDNAVEIISAVRDLKALGKTGQKNRFFRSLLQRRFDTTFRAARLDEVQSIGALFLMEIGEIAGLIVAGTLVINGQTTVGAFVAILFILGQMRGPLSQMVPFFQAAQDAWLSLGRLKALQEETVEPDTAPADAEFAGLSAQDIQLSDVGFRYNPMHEREVLSDISLTIPAGQKTAIVGASGAGKSTLIKLLSKFHDPSRGVMSYGPQDLSDVSPEIWRARIGQVFQDGVIFNSTLRYNITLSHDEPDDERLKRCLQIANVDEFLGMLPQGLLTSIGRGGWQLSAGQKQRILIARALYPDPEILIFDEATSALDSNNEAQITTALANGLTGRTSIVISHRLSTIRDADQIIVMDQGRVVATGRHDDLVATSAVYRDLFAQQLS